MFTLSRRTLETRASSHRFLQGNAGQSQFVMPRSITHSNILVFPRFLSLFSPSSKDPPPTAPPHPQLPSPAAEETKTVCYQGHQGHQNHHHRPPPHDTSRSFAAPIPRKVRGGGEGQVQPRRGMVAVSATVLVYGWTFLSVIKCALCIDGRSFCF